ncbi:MAG: hypothetical protein K0M64_02390, partial [Rhizobium sp.]|nr:hypothetical protein [Rhizobium sp.]
MNAALHLLVLSADPGVPDLERFADTQGHRLERLPPGATPRRVLAVPASELALHRLEMKAATPAQARAAAWHLLDGRLAQPREALELAVGADGDRRWVAVFTPAARERWLARAAARGFLPDAVLPDCLLLPEPTDEGEAFVAADTGLWRVRGHQLAFSAEPALAAQVLGSRPHTRVDASPAIESLLLRGAQAPAFALDLRPPRADKPQAGAVPARRLAALAAALLLSPLLVWAAQGLRHELGAARAEASANAALLAVAPDAAGPGRPLARARAELARRPAPARVGGGGAARRGGPGPRPRPRRAARAGG